MKTLRSELFYVLEDDEAVKIIRETYGKPYHPYVGRSLEHGTLYYEVKAEELSPTDLQNWGKPAPRPFFSETVQPRIWRVLNDLAFREVIPPGLYLMGSVPEPT